MNSIPIINKEKIIKDNYEIIKACINTTLDEEYDFINALKLNDPTDESILTLQQLADEHEELRRKFLEGSLEDLDIESILIIIHHRKEVMGKKLKQMSAALSELEKLEKSFR